MARVKRSVHGKKHRRTILEEAEGYTGSRSRHFRKANEQVMHSRQLRVPRPPGPQGRVPAALDRAHQRRVPRARHLVLAVHRRAEGRRGRRRPQDPRRPRGARAGRVRRARVAPPARRSTPPEPVARAGRRPRSARATATVKRLRDAAARPQARATARALRRRRAARRRRRARPRRGARARSSSVPTPSVAFRRSSRGSRRRRACRRASGSRRRAREGRQRPARRSPCSRSRDARRRPGSRARGRRPGARRASRVADPGNLGTLMRSAEASGAAAIVLGPAIGRRLQSQGRSGVGRRDVRGPGRGRGVGRVVRGGGARRARRRRRRPAGRHRRPGHAARPRSTSPGRPRSCSATRPTGSIADVDAALDGHVTIPMAGPAESLNVAMAGTVLCFESARQRSP